MQPSCQQIVPPPYLQRSQTIQLTRIDCVAKFRVLLLTSLPWFFAARRRISLFAGTTPVPADPILGLVAAFLEDPSPNKVNLAQGAYRTEQGEPLLLDAVRKAEERVVARGGSKEYLGASRSREAPCHTLSGTGWQVI